MKFILSIDGGGMRSILPCTILKEIENKTGKNLSDIFDLMVGTSTGALIVAGLALKNTRNSPKYNANDILEMFREHGANIYRSSWLRQKLSFLFCNKYNNDRIKSVLSVIFDRAKLGDTLTNVMIPTYDLRNRSPFMVKSWRDNMNEFKMVDILTAATSTIAYFSPKIIKHPIECKLIDASVYANNPAVCAYATALTLFPEEELFLLSIGSGKKVRFMKVDNLGKLAWVLPLIHITNSANVDMVDYQLKNMLGKNYMRLETTLKFASPDFDNASDKNIKYLQRDAGTMIHENLNKITYFSNIVKKYKQ